MNVDFAPKALEAPDVLALPNGLVEVVAVAAPNMFFGGSPAGVLEVGVPKLLPKTCFGASDVGVSLTGVANAFAFPKELCPKTDFGTSGFAAFPVASELLPNGLEAFEASPAGAWPPNPKTGAEDAAGVVPKGVDPNADFS